MQMAGILSIWAHILMYARLGWNTESIPQTLELKRRWLIYEISLIYERFSPFYVAATSCHTEICHKKLSFKKKKINVLTPRNKDKIHLLNQSLLRYHIKKFLNLRIRNPLTILDNFEHVIRREADDKDLSRPCDLMTIPNDRKTLKVTQLRSWEPG